MEKVINKFSHYTRENYKAEGIIPIEPMSAKEPLNAEELENMLTSEFYYAEEKLDGVRATLHIREEGNRLFSRRISKKTNWYAENSDNVPHIRDLFVDSYWMGTVLDGELRIEGGDFKDIASVMNCLPQEAVTRQETLGKVTFHAFDIIYYRGVYIAKLPLHERKELLSEVVSHLESPYILEERFVDKSILVDYTKALKDCYLHDKDKLKHNYNNLFNYLKTINQDIDKLLLTKKEWYEYIVFHGGEGLMLKNINGKYKHQRCREYTKLKKFETWDLVIFGYTEPTKYYEGKALNDPNHSWDYWMRELDGSKILKSMTMAHVQQWKERYNETLYPITKNYYYEHIGNIQLGVVMTKEELEQWEKVNKKTAIRIPLVGYDELSLVYIGECGGLTDSERQEISYNKDKFMLKVVEVKGHEVSKKTGAIRHPRFMRFRTDKDLTQCTWKDHIRA